MNESVIEGGQQVNNTEVVLLGSSTAGWGSKVGDFIILDFSICFLGRLHKELGEESVNLPSGFVFNND